LEIKYPNKSKIGAIFAEPRRAPESAEFH